MSNLYLIYQTEIDDYGTFDSAIVCADDRDEARNTLPAPYVHWGDSCWCSSPDKVRVELIGVAARDLEKGCVLSSFNPG